MEFNKPLERFLNDYTEAAGITRAEMIESVLVDFMARLAIAEEFTKDTAEVLLPLAKHDNEVLKGRELFDFLYENRKAEYQRQWRSMTELQMAAGVDLDDEQLAYMKRCRSRMERAKQKATAQIEVQQLKDEGKLPADVYGPSETIMRLYKGLQDGDITEKEFQRRIDHYRKSRRDA